MILNDTGSILLEKIMFGWNEGVNFSISAEKIIKLKSNRFNLYPHSRSYSILLIKMVKREFRWRRKRKTVSFFGFVTLTINFLKLECCWVLQCELKSRQGFLQWKTFPRLAMLLNFQINILGTFRIHSVVCYVTKCQNKYFFMQQFHTKISITQTYVFILFT